MKLRNKKTGEHGDYKVISAGNLIRVHDPMSDESWQYDCLADFNEKWEDYTPVEPLIKDEKIRKAIRIWAAAANVKTDKIRVSKGTFFTSFIGWIDGLVGGLEISFRTSDAFEAINDGAEVTLAELCGEEEEC